MMKLKRKNKWKAWTCCVVFIGWGLVSGQLVAQIQTTFTEPIISSELAAAEAGIVKKILVKEGDYVSQGSIIAELDQSVLQQSLVAAQTQASSNSQINVAKSRLKLALHRHRSLQKLDRDGHANQREVQLAEAEYEQAIAELQAAKDDKQSAEIEVKRIQAQLERRVIRSPFDGHVIKIHKQIGEYVSSGEPQFSTVVVLAKLRARFYLLRDQIVGLKVNDEVQIDIGGRLADGTIVFVSPIVDPDSRTIRIDVEIDNPNNSFPSGITCKWLRNPAGGLGKVATQDRVNKKTIGIRN